MGRRQGQSRSPAVGGVRGPEGQTEAPHLCLASGAPTQTQRQLQAPKSASTAQTQHPECEAGSNFTLFSFPETGLTASTNGPHCHFTQTVLCSENATGSGLYCSVIQITRVTKSLHCTACRGDTQIKTGTPMPAPLPLKKSACTAFSLAAKSMRRPVLPPACGRGRGGCQQCPPGTRGSVPYRIHASHCPQEEGEGMRRAQVRVTM